jgi:hypothetical protein
MIKPRWKARAIATLNPDCSFRYEGETLVWVSGEQPTEEEINAKAIELEAEYEAKQYQRDRVKEYPSMADQLDYIYHNGVEAWKTDMIDPIKQKYPKPE